MATKVEDGFYMVLVERQIAELEAKLMVLKKSHCINESGRKRIEQSGGIIRQYVGSFESSATLSQRSA